MYSVASEEQHWHFVLPLSEWRNLLSSLRDNFLMQHSFCSPAISVKLEDYVFRSVFWLFFWFCMSSICFFLLKHNFFLKATVKRSCAKMRNNTVSSKVIWMWIRSSDQANLLWLMRISSGFDSAALQSVQQRKAVRILRLPKRLQAKKKHCVFHPSVQWK